MLADAPGTLVIVWQFVPVCVQAWPPNPSANCGDPWNTTPRSVDRLQWRLLRGSRLPKPMPSVGANLFSVSAAVPLIGFDALLKYVTPPSVKPWPGLTDAVAVMLLSL